MFDKNHIYFKSFPSIYIKNENKDSYKIQDYSDNT